MNTKLIAPHPSQGELAEQRHLVDPLDHVLEHLADMRPVSTPLAPTPEAEIRTAVAKLRKHVKHATDGPWVTSSVWSPRATSTSAVYSHAHPTGTVESEVVASGRIKSGYGGIREPWNAEYIALMQPAVGAVLADWLDLEADVIEARAAEDGSHEYAVALDGDHALAIARQINGTQVVAS